MKGDKRLGEVVNATMVVVRALLVISYVHTVILLCVQPHPRFNSRGGRGNDGDGGVDGGGDVGSW